MMRGKLAVASGVLLSLSACGTGDAPADRGSMSPSEFNLAVDTAHRIQGPITGTFIGATAIASDRHRPPCDRDAACPDTRLVYIRLVWKDANFTHSGPRRVFSTGKPSMAATVSQSDAQNQAMFIAVDPEAKDIVAQSAGYDASFAADADETLLYGDRP